MARFKSFANGGTLLPADLNSIEDDYEYAFSTYKELRTAVGTPLPGTTAGTYLLVGPFAGVVYSLQASGQSTGTIERTSSIASFYFDPADYTSNGRTNKLRIRAVCLTNAIAPATTLTVGLYPVATFGGVAGNYPWPATLGTVVSGSTVAFSSPSLSTQTATLSGDFTMPSAGHYSLGVVIGGTIPANCYTSLNAELQFRQV